MIFAGQNTVEFGSANYSPDAFVPSTPYSNYVAETVFYTDDPDVVQQLQDQVRRRVDRHRRASRTTPTSPVRCRASIRPTRSTRR